MKTLYIKGTDRDPFIYAEVKNEEGIIKIYGRAQGYFDEAEEQFQPLYDWINQYCSTPNQKVRLEFLIDYFSEEHNENHFLKVINLLNNYQKENKGKAIVNWYYAHDEDRYDDENEDRMAGMCFKNIEPWELEFNVIPFDEVYHPVDTHWPGYMEFRTSNL